MLHQAHLTTRAARIVVTAALVAAATLVVAAPADAAPPPSSSSSSKGRVELLPVTPAEYVSKVVAPHKGRVVVVSFWASYCGPCLVEMPMLVALAAERRDIDVVLVSTDPKEWREKAVAIAKKKAMPAKGAPAVPLFWADSDDPQPFIDIVDKQWAGEMPFTVVYGADGVRAVSLSGEQSKEQMLAAIAKATAPAVPPG